MGFFELRDKQIDVVVFNPLIGIVLVFKASKNRENLRIVIREKVTSRQRSKKMRQVAVVVPFNRIEHPNKRLKGQNRIHVQQVGVDFNVQRHAVLLEGLLKGEEAIFRAAKNREIAVFAGANRVRVAVIDREAGFDFLLNVIHDGVDLEIHRIDGTAPPTRGDDAADSEMRIWLTIGGAIISKLLARIKIINIALVFPHAELEKVVHFFQKMRS